MKVRAWSWPPKTGQRFHFSPSIDHSNLAARSRNYRLTLAALEVLFLVIFWTGVLSTLLLFRNTRLPRMPLMASPEAWQLPFETVRFPATDGVWLAGWKLFVSPNAPWLIACHGLGANRADLLDIAAAFVRAGYNVLLFDFRAHGESQGQVTSFGWREQRDLEGALAFLGSQSDVIEKPYGIFGISMGGAVAVMVAARDERLGAVAVDSTYSDLEESIARHLKLLYRLPRIPFLFFANCAYRFQFGVWPRQMSPVTHIGQISPRPVLIIHGASDPQMPLDEGQRLFEAAKQPKDLWVIGGGIEHLGGFQADPEVYVNRLLGFFDSSLR